MRTKFVTSLTYNLCVPLPTTNGLVVHNNALKTSSGALAVSKFGSILIYYFRPQSSHTFLLRSIFARTIPLRIWQYIRLLIKNGASYFTFFRDFERIFKFPVQALNSGINCLLSSKFTLGNVSGSIVEILSVFSNFQFKLSNSGINCMLTRKSMLGNTAE
ncbi:hypothetical protein SUGI_0110450 [Cryptomeria japonica]|nr:hypothetical protein SUGI_0110450 [Cryptomeria japonica]